MTEYFIARNHDGSYRIAKFDGNSEPAQTYTVKGKSCDCPAGLHRGKCKHLEMVARWKPGYYYDHGWLVPVASYDHENVIVTDTSGTK